MARRICLSCRIAYEGEGSRCARCQREWQAHRNTTRTWYRDPAYIKASAIVRATPAPCWICGQGDRPGDPWTADHVSETELRRAHRSCNSSRGRNHPVFRTASD